MEKAESTCSRNTAQLQMSTEDWSVSCSKKNHWDFALPQNKPWNVGAYIRFGELATASSRLSERGTRKVEGLTDLAFLD